METVVPIGILIALVALVMYLGSLKDKAIDKGVGALNRRVQPKKHSEGSAFIEATHVFAVNAPASEIADALANGVTTRATAPAVGFGETYLVDANESRVEWAHGTKLQTSFRAAAMIGTAQLQAGGETPVVALAVLESSVVEGMVADLASMRKLKADIQRSLTTLDAAVEELDFS